VGGKIEATIIAGNTATETAGAAMVWTGPAASTNIFVNCVTDNAEKINPTCRAALATAIFKNFAAGDYKLGGDSPAIDIGPRLTPQEIAAAGLDLAGRPRVLNDRVDAGCYESKGRTMMIIVR
jgi:hypothetical protein